MSLRLTAPTASDSAPGAGAPSNLPPMTTVGSLEFSVTPNPAPAPEARRAEILANPGFGKFFTDHMVSVTWTPDEGWHDASLRAYGPISMDPATAVIHYAQ